MKQSKPKDVSVAGVNRVASVRKDDAEGIPNEEYKLARGQRKREQRGADRGHNQRAREWAIIGCLTQEEASMSWTTPGPEQEDALAFILGWFGALVWLYLTTLLR